MSAPKPKHNPIKNLGHHAHPPGEAAKERAAAAKIRTHLAHPKRPETSKVVTGSRNPRAKAETRAKQKAVNPGKGKAPRGDYALSGDRFPMNTAGRRKVASKDAAIAERAGSITAAEAARVKAAAKRGGKKG